MVKRTNIVIEKMRSAIKTGSVVEAAALLAVSTSPGWRGVHVQW